MNEIVKTGSVATNYEDPYLFAIRYEMYTTNS